MYSSITILHYSSTALVAIWMLAGGLAITFRKEFIHKAIRHLGYPGYFAYILGAAKLIGAAFLILPFPELFKTIAFSGATVELICATISYYVIDRKISEWIKPMIALAMVWAAFLFWRLYEQLEIFS